MRESHAANLSLERQSQSELNPPRVPHRPHAPEVGVRLLARLIEDGSRIHGRKLRLVERIVQLPAELESSCAAEPDVLEERNVRVDVAGQSQLVTMRCPGSIRRKT